MRVLMISSDEGVLQEGSAVWERMRAYGQHIGEICIILSGGKGNSVKISENVTAYPANSSNKLIALWRAYRIGKKILRSGGDWVVTAQDPFEHGMIANALAEEFQLPLQIQVHTDLLSPFFVSESLKNRLRIWIAKMILPEADGVRVVSKRIADSLLSARLVEQDRITVLPIFVDKGKFAEATPASREFYGFQKEDFIIITAGRDANEKNMNLANEIVGELKRRGHKIKWLHVGYEESRAYASLENKATVAPFYKMADFFLLTSNYEGYGMVAVEAAAAGVPVVMTDVGVALGATFPVGDKNRAVEIIENLIKNPEKRTELIAKQNAFFENWPTSEEYLEKYTKSLNLHYFDRLLFITQKVDLDDDVLGVYHSWIAELAGAFKKISVISLYKGRVELPGRIAVHSLGKESGRSFLKYIFRFYKNLWRLRGQYDVVFVHMNAEYMLLAGLLWKLSGKKILFWYNHPQGNWKARIGFMLADRILHTSPFAFSANRPKSVRMPVGIDTDTFRAESGVSGNPKSILCLGRISPIKYIEVLIEALDILDKKNIDFSATIAGSPSKESEKAYEELLRNQAELLIAKGKIRMQKGIPNYEAPRLYNSHAVYVNMTPTGSFDKAILEAMACQSLVVASNEALRNVLAPQLFFLEKNPKDLARALEAALSLPIPERKEIGLKMRKYVTGEHDLGALVKRVREMLK